MGEQETVETRAFEAGESPGLIGSAPSGGALSGGTTSVVSTPAEALTSEEIERTRQFAAFVGLLCFTAPGLLLITHGNRVAALVHFVGLIVGCAASIATIVVLRRPERFRTWHVVAYGCCCAIAMNTAFPYYGETSIAALMIPIGTYFFGLGRSLRAGLVVVLLVLVPFAVWSVLVIAEVVESRAVIRPVTGAPEDPAVALVLVEFICITTFIMARKVRSATIRNLEQLHQTGRELAKREALLEEARQELGRYARVGGQGRYTGQVLGSYRLGHIIGRGAMGEVYEASRDDTGDTCALKLLLPSAFTNLALVHRFRREVEIAAALDVDNVAKVLELPDADAPVPYLAMERLHGATLGEILREQPTLPLDEVVAMVDGIGAGLAAAHAEGIVHRDIKPQNLFRHEPDEGPVVWKVLDFGVSKLADSQGTMTAGGVVGTPAYMSPEQAKGRDVDQRSDVYSLAVVVYRAVTGRPAFAGRETPAIMYSVVHDTPPRADKIADVPSQLATVVAKAMEKDPANRYAGIDELLAAFHASLI